MEEKIDFNKANKLLDHLSESKAMVLAVPIIYQKLFPSIGVEIDLEKIEYIDYTQRYAALKEEEFYKYWYKQTDHLKVVSQELANVGINSIEDVNLDILDSDLNVASIATTISEIFTSDILKDGLSKFVDEALDNLLSDLQFELETLSISEVNKTLDQTPYFINISGNESDVVVHQGKYYINGQEVVLEANNVIYNGQRYTLQENTLFRIWHNEISNLAIIVRTLKNGLYLNSSNISQMFDALSNMILFNNVKDELIDKLIEKIVGEIDFFDSIFK